MSQFFASGGQSIGVSASTSVPPMNTQGLISFRMDWLDLLAVQRILKSLLQHHSSKASILQHLAFFIVQLSHLYMTTGKTVALTRWTFVGKVMSLLFSLSKGTWHHFQLFMNSPEHLGSLVGEQAGQGPLGKRARSLCPLLCAHWPGLHHFPHQNLSLVRLKRWVHCLIAINFISKFWQLLSPNVSWKFCSLFYFSGHRPSHNSHYFMLHKLADGTITPQTHFPQTFLLKKL